MPCYLHAQLTASSASIAYILFKYAKGCTAGARISREEELRVFGLLKMIGIDVESDNLRSGRRSRRDTG